MREREAALRRHLRRGLALCEPGGSSPFPFAPPTTSHAPPSLSRSSSSEPAQDANILCRSHTGNIVRRIRFIGSWSNIRSKGCNPPPPQTARCWWASKPKFEKCTYFTLSSSLPCCTCRTSNSATKHQNNRSESLGRFTCQNSGQGTTTDNVLTVGFQRSDTLPSEE